jgi:GTPase SAR1 family protein
MNKSKTLLQKKICVLGMFGVGKTSLIRKFIYDVFDDQYLSTIGVKVSQKLMPPVEVKPGQFLQMNFLIWDVEGFESKSSHFKNYLIGAAGAFIVADLTRKNTIAHIPEIKNLFMSINPHGHSLILGNKLDLIDKKHPNLDVLAAICTDLRLPFLYTSAKTGDNVPLAFEKLGKLIAST